jgi:hypothetical protein
MNLSKSDEQEKEKVLSISDLKEEHQPDLGYLYTSK